MANTALYYPWIHFRDENWVKLSLLYRQRVHRIVPAGYHKHDGHVVETFAAEGLVRDVEAGRNAGLVADLFSAFIESHAEALHGLYAVRNATHWTHVAAPRHFSVPRVGTSGAENFAFIHVDKVAEALRSALLGAGLAAYSRGGDERWLGVHPEIARVYMTALADAIARQSGMTPVTDNETDFVASSGWSVEALAEALLSPDDVAAASGRDLTEEAASMLAVATLSTIVPADLTAVDAETIVRLRSDCSEEFVAFHDALDAIALQERLAQVTDPHALKEYLDDIYTDRIRPRVAELEKAMRVLRIPTVSSFINMRVQLPAAAGLAATAAGVDDPAVVLPGAALIGLWELRSRRIDRLQADFKTNPMAYLFRVRDALEPRSVRERLQRQFRRYAIGA